MKKSDAICSQRLPERGLHRSHKRFPILDRRYIERLTNQMSENLRIRLRYEVVATLDQPITKCFVIF